MHDDHGRRRFLGRLIATIQTAIGGSLAFMLGGAVVSPGFGRRETNWLTAAHLGDLPQNEPTAVTVGVLRQDGYTQTIDRRTVFLIRTGDAEVTALDSTCTHLGCRVSWDRERAELRCPCHGGVYDKTGAVKAGPPPRALATIAARVDDGRVLVQL